MPMLHAQVRADLCVLLYPGSTSVDHGCAGSLEPWTLPDPGCHRATANTAGIHALPCLCFWNKSLAILFVVEG